MKRKMQSGQTSVLMKVWIQNSSSGLGLTGLAYNTSGLTAYYIRNGQSTDTAITLATATLGTWTSGGFVVVDGTNMPGLYEIGMPNAVLASGVDTVHLMLQGAANMVPCVLEIELDAVNYQSTGFGLVNVSANVVQSNGTTNASTPGYFAPDWGHVNAPTTTLALSGTTISTSQVAASVTGAVGSVAGNVAGSVASVAGAVGSVTGSVGSVTGNVGGNVSGNVAGTVGYIVNAPFKINTANGFSIFMVQSSDNKSPFTAGGVSATRSIAGGAQTAVTGTVTQVGGTNEYYFSGAAADFNGTTVSFIFTATGANTVQVTVNTQP
jgi:hypothetical protein